MSLIIQKYGGTSVNSIQLRDKIVDNLKKARESGYISVIVVSAMGREGEHYSTDSLIKLISPIHNNTRNMDMLLSCGEIISATVLTAHLIDHGFDAIALTGGQAGIITDNHYGESTILDVNVNYLKELISMGKVPVVAGFQGINASGEITTLGRGGSDTSAVLLGIALKAKEIEIFTDVDGIMTADPKLVPNANLIRQIAYDEVFQLSQYGAKVIHPRAVDLAMKENIPIKVYNTSKYRENSGTTINSKCTEVNSIVTAIAHEDSKTQWNLEMISTNNQVFIEMANNFISIDMINIFKDKSIFITHSTHKHKIIDILIQNNISYTMVEDCTKITIIGSKIRGVPGVMSKVINSLQEKHDILQTSDSHTTISILVKSKYAKEAITLLHKTFNL
ncbi:aspartate kinase [Alkalibaculum sporogenes]|uniref:aspartate kinase n=1 Tax=Alkalibaculum sporogenes TaxID=2655001 RepID=UPI00128E482D|nr:aspartate kinase [Alkalibaculum sporogenes]